MDCCANGSVNRGCSHRPRRNGARVAVNVWVAVQVRVRYVGVWAVATCHRAGARGGGRPEEVDGRVRVRSAFGRTVHRVSSDGRGSRGLRVNISRTGTGTVGGGQRQ
jgi:hypothetical protein